MEPVALVAVGGAVGATGRHLVGRLLGEAPAPVATLLVNVVGSFALGVVVFGGLGRGPALLVGTGLCGAFTTYSSFSLQTVALYRRRGAALAVLNAVGTLALALAAVGLASLLV